MTAQATERIIIDGQEERMPFCPDLPTNPDLIEEAAREDYSIYISTACWRGYVGTWQIIDEKMYLVNIKGKYKLKASEPIFADWFSGTLKVWKGKMVYYHHGGFESIYEYDLYIEIKNGIVQTQRTQDNTGKKWDWDAFWIYHHGCTMAESMAKYPKVSDMFPSMNKKEG